VPKSDSTLDLGFEMLHLLVDALMMWPIECELVRTIIVTDVDTDAVLDSFRKPKSIPQNQGNFRDLFT
jgi:hypothetical protein